MARCHNTSRFPSRLLHGLMHPFSLVFTKEKRHCTFIGSGLVDMVMASWAKSLKNHKSWIFDHDDNLLVIQSINSSSEIKDPGRRPSQVQEMSKCQTSKCHVDHKEKRETSLNSS